MAGGSFNCGHPHEGNTYSPASGGRRCAFCQRTKTLRETVDRKLERWKTGTPTAAERRVRKYCD